MKNCRSMFASPAVAGGVSEQSSIRFDLSGSPFYGCRALTGYAGEIRIPNKKEKSCRVTTLFVWYHQESNYAIKCLYLFEFVFRPKGLSPAVAPPKNRTTLQGFTGSISYYDAKITFYFEKQADVRRFCSTSKRNRISAKDCVIES